MPESEQSGGDDGEATGAEAATGELEEHDEPRGTMVLMLGFLLLIAVLWFWAYWSMWARG